jgi:2-keto-3-deoxy-6-phosphogluconate aldolase
LPVQGFPGRVVQPPGNAARQCRPPTEIVIPGPSVPGLGPIRFQGAIETGYTEPKFFPAEAAGGANYLKSVSSPIPAARFCPTGGISTTTAASYLTVLHVGCVGGSWITVRRPRSTRLGTHHRTSHRRVKALTPALNRI